MLALQTPLLFHPLGFVVFAALEAFAETSR
jgi:hypothetical protein